MPKRKCDSCGKEKEVKGGKVCANGHFICSECVYGSGVLQVLFGTTQKSCPLCGKRLT